MEFGEGSPKWLAPWMPFPTMGVRSLHRGPGRTNCRPDRQRDGRLAKPSPRVETCAR
jgi:hypothetical protein